MLLVEVCEQVRPLHYSCMHQFSQKSFCFFPLEGNTRRGLDVSPSGEETLCLQTTPAVSFAGKLES